MRKESSGEGCKYYVGTLVQSTRLLSRRISGVDSPQILRQPQQLVLGEVELRMTAADHASSLFSCRASLGSHCQTQGHRETGTLQYTFHFRVSIWHHLDIRTIWPPILPLSWHRPSSPFLSRNIHLLSTTSTHPPPRPRRSPRPSRASLLHARALTLSTR